MDMFWCLLLALLLHQATCTSDGAEVTGAVGRSVTFHLKNLDKEATAWSFRNDVIVTVKFGDPPEATFFDDNYKPRLAFSKNGSALTISQLRMEDAGTYTAKTLGVKATFTLHVYRELAVLTVTCVAQNCSAGDCLYTLHCTALGSGSGNISYSWSAGGLSWQEGPTVLVEESSPDKPLIPLTCTAQNPVSSRNVTIISPSALCAENTSHPPTTGTYSSRQAGIMAALVTGAGALLAVVIFVIYCKFKGWRIFHLPAAEAMNTEARAEDMTVYAQVGPSQQVHLQNFSKAQQDDPKKMPNASVETFKTIYFTIQAHGHVPCRGSSAEQGDGQDPRLQTDDEKMGNGMAGCQEQDERSVYSLVS
ncbi:SLAM family member 5-like isoform X1 [Haliaeetus albicilla]|uniref:SLAM family member 5-like isoform X1 n=1 Tax=Haliaeetus albicilla TaxID=8969 RepID=UPI0037E7D970